jgi:hypothetical protein
MWQKVMTAIGTINCRERRIYLPKMSMPFEENLEEEDNDPVEAPLPLACPIEFIAEFATKSRKMVLKNKFNLKYK